MSVDAEEFFRSYSKKELTEILVSSDITAPAQNELKAKFIEVCVSELGDEESIRRIGTDFIPRRRKSTRNFTDSEAELDDSPKKRPRRSRTPTIRSQEPEDEIEEVREEREDRRRSFEIVMQPLSSLRSPPKAVAAEDDDDDNVVDAFLRRQDTDDLRKLLQSRGVEAPSDAPKSTLVQKAAQSFESVEEEVIGEMPKLNEYFSKCSKEDLELYLQQMNVRQAPAADMQGLIRQCIAASSEASSDQSEAMWTVWGGKHWTTKPFEPIQQAQDSPVTFSTLLFAGIIGYIRSYGFRAGAPIDNDSFANTVFPGSAEALQTMLGKEGECCVYLTLFAAFVLLFRGKYVLKFTVGACVGLILASALAGWEPLMWPLYFAAFVVSGLMFDSCAGVSSLMAALMGSFLGNFISAYLVKTFAINGAWEVCACVALPIGVVMKVGSFWVALGNNLSSLLNKVSVADSCKVLFPQSIRSIIFALTSQYYVIGSLLVSFIILLLSVSVPSETFNTVLGSDPTEAKELGQDVSAIISGVVTVFFIGFITIFAEKNEEAFLALFSSAVGAYLIQTAFPSTLTSLFGLPLIFLTFPLGCWAQLCPCSGC